MEITAAVARRHGEAFQIERLELEEPRADEIRVRIAAVGICHTDLVYKDRQSSFFKLPAVLGHEGAGIVDAVGASVTKVKPGDRVALSFRSCGACPRCESGDPAYCHSMPYLNFVGQRPDGTTALARGDEVVSSNFFGQSSFASHALAYESNVVRLPEDIPLSLAAPLGCGVQTGAASVMKALAASPGSSILITGGGSVGLAAVMGAVIQKCSTIIVLEPHASRRTLALELGATHAWDPAQTPDLTAAILELLPHGVDFVLETTGRVDIIDASVAALASKGVLGFVGILPEGAKLQADLRRMLAYGQSVRGILEGDADPNQFIPELVEHWRAGRLPLERIVRTYPFEDINAAIDAQHRGDCVKVVLTF